MNGIKRYIIKIVLAVALFFGKQTYDRRVGARQNDAKRDAEDRDAAREIADRARDARARAARDPRDPVERVRATGGLRDDDTDRR